MRRVFTEYLRAFDPSGAGYQPELFDELWTALRAALVSELKKRGLWSASPTRLGVWGHERWDSRSSAGREEALEELLTDCYVFIFVQRVWSLRAQLEIKDNVDGLVFLNIRHFLVERQRCHDPLGFQVFQLLRTAVRESVDAGDLHLLDGDAGIRSDSVLGFAGPRRLPALEPDWRALAGAWSDELLPDLVTAKGRHKRRVIGEARRLLRRLLSEGVTRFAFGALVQALEREVRARWRAVGRQEAGERALDAGDGDALELVAVVHPDRAWEERRSFSALAARVEERIARQASSPATEHHLGTLWAFLCSYAAGREPVRGRDGAESLPSQRRLATLLGIPRNRLPELLGTLRALVAEESGRSLGSVTELQEEAEVPRIPRKERHHER